MTIFCCKKKEDIFCHVGTEPPLPGYYQYFLGGKCILLKDRFYPRVMFLKDTDQMANRIDPAKTAPLRV